MTKKKVKFELQKIPKAVKKYVVRIKRRELIQQSYKLTITFNIKLDLNKLQFKNEEERFHGCEQKQILTRLCSFYAVAFYLISKFQIRFEVHA